MELFTVYFFFLREDKLAFTFRFFARDAVYFLAGNFWKEALLKFLPKMLPGDTLCKLIQIFPPKVLVYTRKISLTAFSIYLIETK